jgi:hypothetical protein
MNKHWIIIPSLFGAAIYTAGLIQKSANESVEQWNAKARELYVSGKYTIDTSYPVCQKAHLDNNNILDAYCFNGKKLIVTRLNQQ